MNDLSDPRGRFKGFHAGRANFFLVAVITCILCGAVLKISSGIVVPFIISLLLALVINPLLAIPERFRIPRIIPILFSTILIIAILYFIGVVVFSSGRMLLNLYPRYETRLSEIYLYLGRFLDLPYNDQMSFFENMLAQLGVRSFILSATYSLSKVSLFFLRDALIVVLFMVFLLIEAAFFREKLETAFEGKTAIQIKKIGTDIMRQVSRYLSIKFIISVVNGIVIGGLLRLTGLEFALVWGILQFIMNFIPSLGSIALGVIVSLFAIIQFWPEPQPIIMVMIIMLGINLVFGFVLEPKVMGDNLGLAPIVVLLSLVIWGFILGFAGMILAVPITVIIKIICENVPVLEPISIILGSRKAVLSKKAEYDSELSAGA